MLIRNTRSRSESPTCPLCGRLIEPGDVSYLTVFPRGSGRHVPVHPPCLEAAAINHRLTPPQPGEPDPYHAARL